MSVSDTDIIEGGTEGDWSTPLKFVQDGERGLQGAAIRGPQDWDNLFPQGETHSYRFSSGKPDVAITDAEFLDLAYDDADGHYYMCKLSYTADQTSPRPSADPTHWYQADAQYEFIATRVLLATSAKIKFLSNNEILLMYGNNVTGGAKGAANADDIVFWAGASGSTDDPLSRAPYRVTRGGKLYATNAEITGAIRASGNIPISGESLGYALFIEDHGMYVNGYTKFINAGTRTSTEVEINSGGINLNTHLTGDYGNKAKIEMTAIGGVNIAATPGNFNVSASAAKVSRPLHNDEHIVSSPTILSIVKETGTHTGTDENTLYIVI